ncbi:MAG TPA: Ig-like domain-containing protein [Planctomycetota bacterium]|nr:Ig-like domain-containing protein [Planctomycetota bacterium]
MKTALRAAPTATSSRTSRASARVFTLLLGACAFALAACGRTSPAPSSSNTPGTLLVNPATGHQIVVDPNHGGQAHRIQLLGAFWGRLVDVYDFDASNNLTSLQFEDFVIGDNITSDLIHYRLDRNSVTEAETLTILHPAGTPEFASALAQIDLNVQPIKKNGTNPLPTATLSAIPRNSAVVLMFDDLLDASLISSRNIAVLTGYPPTQPYETRVIPDASHGDLFDADGDGAPEFHTTRVILDMTVSQVEAQQSNPPLSPNALGLPEASVANQPNVLLRIPTRATSSVGQLEILANLSGSGLEFASNLPNDPASPTLDVVRSMRSSSSDLGDPNNGFLVDDIAPRIVGVQSVNLMNIVFAGGTHYLVDALFDAPSCAPQPQVGDVIRIGNAALAVVDQVGAAPSGGFITNVSVDLQVGSASSFLTGQAQYLMPYDPTLTVLPDCFVRFSPTPAAQPSQGVAPVSTITVRFSEPMDPTSVSGFETFSVARVSNASATSPFMNTVVGSVQASLDLKEFTYTPVLGFDRNPSPVNGHPAGELYRLTVAGGANGVIDLSGKALAATLPAFNFQLAASAPTLGAKGFVFNFNSGDQDNNNAPELRGQFLFNLSKGTIRARPVTRFSAVADANQPVVGIMAPGGALQAPLSNLGSKLMTVYRYHDLGLSLLDDSTLNIDVEGLSWAPSSAVQVDHYARFRMALCHSKFLPDEVPTLTGAPAFPLSGLVGTFDANQVDAVNDPLKVVHPKDMGYNVQPVDAFVSGTGTLMMPYPLNQNLTKAQYARYTFRDTGILAVGGPNGSGVDTGIFGIAMGVTAIKAYDVNKVPTLGLPLLMEFRCYPDDGAFGLNGLKVNIALPGNLPAFRAFSVGGVLASGALVKVDPDNEPNASGGFAGGVPTGPGSELDTSFYLGQADFVVRVNRVHTIWLDSFAFNPPVWQTPVLDPPNALQPTGTQVIIAVRGGTNITNGTAATGGAVPSRDATKYDPYGDPKAAVLNPPPTTGFVNWTINFVLGPDGLPDKTWKSNMSQFNSLPGGFGPRYIQARITLLSNPDTGLVPELSGLGLAFKY